jgi:hypothetical protein
MQKAQESSSSSLKPLLPLCVGKSVRTLKITVPGSYKTRKPDASKIILAKKSPELKKLRRAVKRMPACSKTDFVDCTCLSVQWYKKYFYGFRLVGNDTIRCFVFHSIFISRASTNAVETLLAPVAPSLTF